MIVVLMGVSGSGKTTIGTLLAQRTGETFADADDYHSAANKAKMHAGIPLTDEDRQPWLQALHSLLRGWYEHGTNGILACSALKESYRTTLAAEMPAGAVRMVLLNGSKELFAQRIARRHHAYMNSSLLDSQFQALEMPKDALVIENDRTPDEVVTEMAARLGIDVLRSRQEGS